MGLSIWCLRIAGTIWALHCQSMLLGEMWDTRTAPPLKGISRFTPVAAERIWLVKIPVDLAAAFLQKLMQQSTPKKQSAISPGTLFLIIDGAFALFCF